MNEQAKEFESSSSAIIAGLASRLYDRKIMDNRERGDYAEQLVAQAIGSSWKWVGIGWKPWDFERGTGDDRVRIQVKQSAAKQVWKPPARRRRTFQIPRRSRPPSYFRDYWPNEPIEVCGHFCDLFVFAWHGIDDDSCDHRRADQWDFFVVPKAGLIEHSSVRLEELQNGCFGRRTCWRELGTAVEDLSNAILGGGDAKST